MRYFPSSRVYKTFSLRSKYKSRKSVAVMLTSMVTKRSRDLNNLNICFLSLPDLYSRQIYNCQPIIPVESNMSVIN